MYPVEFEARERLQRSDKLLAEHDGLSAVIFCTGTSGLEARLCGLPTFRLITDDRVSVNVMPRNIPLAEVTIENVTDALDNAEQPSTLDWGAVFSPVRYTLWREFLSDDSGQAACRQRAEMPSDLRGFDESRLSRRGA